MHPVGTPNLSHASTFTLPRYQWQNEGTSPTIGYLCGFTEGLERIDHPPRTWAWWTRPPHWLGSQRGLERFLGLGAQVTVEHLTVHVFGAEEGGQPVAEGATLHFFDAQ